MADFDNERVDRFRPGDTDRKIAAVRSGVDSLDTVLHATGAINTWTFGRPCPVPNTPLAQRTATQTREPLPGLTADTDADLGAFELGA